MDEKKQKKNTDGIVQSNRSETTQGEVNDEKKNIGIWVKYSFNAFKNGSFINNVISIGPSQR